jgi:XTP/dITP diphosphohydrolase
MVIVLATTNRKKVREMKRMFAGCDIEFLALEAFPGCPEVVEDGRTFRANALKKAISVSNSTGYAALADDSGLEVDALGGAPGVFSARYAGENADDNRNMKKVLREMKHINNKDSRRARFKCCIALVLQDGRRKTFTGSVEGIIGEKPKGANGFGYDPIFFPVGHDRSFAEMADSEKDAISHRGRAIRKLYAYLKTLA